MPDRAAARTRMLLIGNSGMVPVYKDGVAPPPKPGSGPSFGEFRIS